MCLKSSWAHHRVEAVILQFSFCRFLNWSWGNCQNPVWNLETQDLCPISGNLWENEVRKPMELKETWETPSMSREKSTDRLLTVAIGFVVSGFPKLGNWWKPAKTRILFWHFADGQVVPTFNLIMKVTLISFLISKLHDKQGLCRRQSALPEWMSPTLYVFFFRSRPSSHNTSLNTKLHLWSVRSFTTIKAPSSIMVPYHSGLLA